MSTQRFQKAAKLVTAKKACTMIGKKLSRLHALDGNTRPVQINFTYTGKRVFFHTGTDAMHSVLVCSSRTGYVKLSDVRVITTTKPSHQTCTSFVGSILASAPAREVNRIRKQIRASASLSA